MRDGEQHVELRSHGQTSVAAKPVTVIKCSILPEPFVPLPLGDRVSLDARLAGPGGTHREFATQFVTVFTDNGFDLQGCAEPDDDDVCGRTLNLTLGYDPSSTSLGTATVFLASYAETTVDTVQGARWASSGGRCEITKSTNGRIGGYFEVVVGAASEAAHQIVPRFTIQGSFVVVRP